jgi:hypothetical protein
MKEQEYGRIVVTTSSSGLYGNFGQTNYGAAKMGVIGMMNTLVQEGAKYNIRVNALAPTAGTRMTEGLMPEKAFELLTPETVTPAVLYMVSEDGPNRTILCAGAGSYAVAKIVETEGTWLPPEEQTPEGIAANWERSRPPRANAPCRRASSRPARCSPWPRTVSVSPSIEAEPPRRLREQRLSIIYAGYPAGPEQTA